jgi:hypothetical protein
MNVNTFSPYEDYAAYSPFGRNYGNPVMNLMMQGLYGAGYTPRPDSGQSVYDAFIQRERSAQFMNLQRSGFMNNQISKSLGISENPLTGLAGRFMGSPDGLLARAMSPLLGGNPMAAQMQTYAGLAGADIMGNFGRIGAITPEETEAVMQSLAKNFYAEQQYETAPDGTPGARKYVQDKTRKFITDRLEEGETGINYLKDLGIELDLDDEGKLTEKGMEQLEKIDITSPEGGADTEITRNVKDRIRRKRQVVNMLDVDVEKLIDESDESVKKEYNERLEEQLKKYNVATEEQLKKLKNKDGQLNTEKVRDLLEKTAELDPIERLTMEGEAYREGKGRFKGFNFENSRGFKLEDFTSAFNKAAELRLLGDRRGSSPAAAMADFSKNAGGALDAARSLFGNDLSGAQLVERINDFVGTATYDLSSRESSVLPTEPGEAPKVGASGPSSEPDPRLGEETAKLGNKLSSNDAGKDAQGIEDILRKAKATARVAGVSLEAMFGIIDSAKELARNNPQLQYLSSSTVTEMSVKAIETAATMGAVMSPEDYRKAGGSQGIAAKEITSEQEYLQSGYTGGLAALLQMAKGKSPELYEELKQQFSSGEFTPQDYADPNFLANVSEKLGMDTSLVVANMSRADLQQRALADEDISSSLRRGAKGTMTRSFYEGMEMMGISEEEIKQKFKEAQAKGISAGTFFDSELLTNMPMTEDSQRFANMARSSVMQDLYMSTMTEEQKTRVKNLIDTQAKTEADMSKRLGGLNAPMVTQMVNAVASGENIGEITQAIEGLFTTEGVTSPKLKKAREQSLKGAEGIAAASAMEGGDATISDKMAEGVNAVIQGRIAEARQTGDTELAEKLGEISSEDLENAAVQLKTVGSVKTAKRDLQDFRTRVDKGEDLNELDQSMFNALETAEKMGLLESEAAFDMANNGGVRNLGAAAIESRRQQLLKAETDKAKEETLTTAEKRIDEFASSASGEAAELIGRAKENYKKEDGSVDVEKMVADYSTTSGMFASEEVRKKYSDGAGGQLGVILSQTQGSLSTIDDKLKATGAQAPEDKGMGDMKDILKQFKEVFEGGGGIASALQALTSALTS